MHMTLQMATHVPQECEVCAKKILRKLIPTTLTISKHFRKRNVQVHIRTRKNFLILNGMK